VSGEDCVACSPGKYQFTADLCEDCAIGTYSPHGAAACTDCATGRYAPKKGTKSCKYCDAGKFSEFTKQTGACQEKCQPGSYAMPGADKCEQCPEKTYQPEAEAGECLYCKTSQGTSATECMAYSAMFSQGSLIAFVALGALGIATCFRRQCETYDVKFCADKATGKKTDALDI